jgi:exodeoxyribonuclease V alpha subunit
VTKLQTCVRVESEAILKFAHSIQKGETPAIAKEEQEVLKIHDLPERTGVAWLETMAKCWSEQHFPSYEEARLYYQHKKVLTPLRKGFWGVESVNNICLQRVLAGKKGSQFIPIMVTQNDAEQELYNGDMGILHLKCLPLTHKDNLAYLQSGEKRPAPLLPAFEPAFCLSVHKSQGSEFEHVDLLLPRGSETFGKEVLYTAATRAKKSLHIYGNMQTINETLKRSCQRICALEERKQNIKQ